MLSGQTGAFGGGEEGRKLRDKKTANHMQIDSTRNTSRFGKGYFLRECRMLRCTDILGSHYQPEF